MLYSHVIAAANTVLSGATARDVTSLSKTIVDHFVHISVPSKPADSSNSAESTDATASDDTSDSNKVTLYAMQVLSLGLIWHNFHDAIKEGDGNRIIQCWKFLLLAFKATNRKNYSIEALNLLLQVNYLLSPREAAQVKWCCTVNTTNFQGHNVPMDLHLEHLNRRLKSAIRNMGSNVTDNSVKLAAESVDFIDHVWHVFETASSRKKRNSDKHSCPSFDKDLALILSVLLEQDFFTTKEQRHHKTFKNLKDFFTKLKYKPLLKWIKHTTNSLMD